MSLNPSATLMTMIALISGGLLPGDAQAGPLIDWLFGRSQTAPAYPIGAPVPVGSAYGAGYASGYGATGFGLPGLGQYPANSNVSQYPPTGYAGNYGTYYSSQLPAIGPAGAGYTAPMPNGIAAATLPATMPPTLSYVPNFQTQAQRTPVTYYRPLLTTDPNTGAQVVAMAPCTSYEYMAQRTPVLGRSALFGSNAAPQFQPPTQAFPTYTLPSGGIPLAYSAPSITAPYSTAYGAYGTNNGISGYSALQPSSGTLPSGLTPSSVGPAGAYPTAPLTQSPYYGTTTGGSSGGSTLSTPWQTVPNSVPGLVAPQAPISGLPSNYGSPAYPDSGFGSGGVMPPSTFSQPEFQPAPSVNPPANAFPSGGAGGFDPADVAPQLPSTSDASAAAPPARSNLRPQLRSVVRYPQSTQQPSSVHSGSSNSRNESGSTSDTRGGTPAMLPIPAPEDFNHEPRWNPGLLREDDMTAMRPIEPAAAQWAGHAKPIVWASFESPSPRSEGAAGKQGADLDLDSLQPQTTGAAQASAAQATAPVNRLRPILTSPSVRRDASGWKASR